MVYIIQCIVLCLIFGIFVTVLELINPLSFVSDYPPEIQEEYYKSQGKQATKKKITIVMAVKKSIALAVFVLAFAWMAHCAGAVSFQQGLLAVYGYAFVLWSFDIVIMDWILFANLKKIRLLGTEHMDKEYHPKWFHVKVTFPMIPVFLILGAVSAWIMILIW